MSRLTISERAEACKVGWQSECARQDRATHLVNSYTVPREAAKKLPADMAECIEIGRRDLRAHLKAVRS